MKATVRCLALLIAAVIPFTLYGCGDTHNTGSTGTAAVSPSPQPSEDDFTFSEANYMTAVVCDFDGDGQSESLTFSQNDIQTDITLQAGQSKFNYTIEAGQYGSQYIYTHAGRSAVLIDFDMASDDYLTYVISYNGGALSALQLPGSIRGMNRSSLLLAETINVFGTWIGTAEYEVSDSLIITRIGDMYVFEENSSVTTKAELTAFDSNEKEVAIPANTDIFLSSSNLKDTVNFTLNNSDFRFDIQPDDNNSGFLVNGIIETQAFKDLNYFD